MGARHHPYRFRRYGVHLLITLAIATLAFTNPGLASPGIRIEAQIDNDLRTIHGTLHTEGLPNLSWVNPLADLPEPMNDRYLFRTYPGRPHHGEIVWEIAADGSLEFETRLPRRFGAIGATANALLANGAWYPQPLLVDGTPPQAHWDVVVELPEGSSGALGDATGSGQLAWNGLADRAPLGVLRGASVTHLSGTDWSLDLVHRGHRRTLRRELVTQLEQALEGTPSVEGAAIVGRLRRRLVRPGPGLAFISDRAYRLTPPLQRFHRVAVTRGVMAALTPSSDPFLRDVAAAGLSTRHAEALRGEDAERLLRRFRWLPSISFLLHSNQMPFYAETLEYTHPGDRLLDDLSELYGPYTPGTVVAAQLDDTLGSGTAVAVALALLDHAPLPVPEEWLDQWRAPYPQQDYRLQVDLGTQTATLTRDAPSDAPEETVIVSVDGTRHSRTGPSGTWTIDLPPNTHRVRIDPDGHIRQTSRVNDAWPRRYDVTASAGLSSINLSEFQVTGSAWATLRRQWDTRNLWTGQLSTSRTTLVGASVGYRRKLGRLLDGINRPMRIGGSIGSSLLNSSFAERDSLQPTAEIGLVATWDDRISSSFPLRGKRTWLSLDNGIVPATGESWTIASIGVRGVLPLHPRHVVALRTGTAWARSDIPHRLLALGGPAVMISVPAVPACQDGNHSTFEQRCTRLATLRGLAATEYRVAPLRNASVPLFLAWGTELQLAVGLEGLIARVDEQSVWATGSTVGISGVGNVLGAEPMMIGATAGWPLAWHGLAQIERSAVPEIFIRWSQRF